MKKTALNLQAKKQLSKRLWKKVVFIAILYAIVAILLSKRDNKAKVSGSFSENDQTTKTTDSLSKNDQTTKAFGSLSQQELDAIVKSTPRGVSAVLLDGILTYTYHSASGKTNNTALFQINDGEVTCNLGSGPYSYAGSPQMFYSRLLLKLELTNENAP